MIECYGADGKKTDLSARPVWIDITGTTKEDTKKLEETFHLHPLTAEDLFNPHVRIKVETFPDYTFFVFYALDKNAQPVEFDAIVGKDFCITNQKKKLSAASPLKEDPEKIAKRLARGPEFIFHHILDEEVDHWITALEKLDDRLERIDDLIMDNPTNAVYKKIRHMKQHVIHLRRVSFNQREKLRELAKIDVPFISKKAVPYFRDVTDHAIRVADSLDSLREAVTSLGEAYMGAVSQKMNEVMKVLSIIATIALPLTVISGIYGTNFAILPGQHAPQGFWAMIAAMVALTIGMMWMFRRKGWF